MNLGLRNKNLPIQDDPTENTVLLEVFWTVSGLLLSDEGLKGPWVCDGYRTIGSNIGPCTMTNNPEAFIE